MALETMMLVFPVGRIHPDMFPELSPEALDTAIGEWLDEAYAKTSVTALATQTAKDNAARTWAYHRAFDAVCIAMSTSPAAADMKDQGSSKYDKDQRQTICGLAAGFLEEFEGLSTVPAGASGGRTVRHNFVW